MGGSGNRTEVKRLLFNKAGTNPSNSPLRAGTIFSSAATICAIAYGAHSPAHSEELAVSGRIESYETSIGVAVPGRTKIVGAKEGDKVHKGQLLIQLEDQELQARLKGINLVLSAAQQQQVQARDWLKALKAELAKANTAPSPPKPGVPNNPNQVMAKTELKAVVTASNAGEKPRILAVSAQSEVVPVEEESLATMSLSAQLSALDEALKFEEATIDEAYAAQKKALEEGFRAKRSALDDAFKTKFSALDEGYKLKTSTFKHGLLSSISGANKAKHIAADEIYKTKKAALEDAQKTKEAALDEAQRADEAALEQAIKAKRQAVEETFKTKRQALTQVSQTEAAMERTMKHTQDSFKAELAKLQSGLSEKLTAAPAASLGTLGDTLKAAQLSNLKLQVSQVEASIATADTEVAKAKAAREEALAKCSYFKVTAPVEGVCSKSNINVGEVAVPGQSLMTIVDLNNVYMRAFIPEGSIGKIKIGQSAQVFLDSSKTPLIAHVVAIDPQASFTPENVYFKDDRVKQVFGVKIKIDNPGGLAKPGMPADGKINLGDVH